MTHPILLQLKKYFLRFIDNKGYILLPKKAYNSYVILYEKSLHPAINLDTKVDSIVFSKDRAMQLHAFLSSFMQNVCNYGDGVIYILYKASDIRHRKSYEDLKVLFKDAPCIFVEETNFRIQLLDIIRKSTAETIGFYVDDMIFLRKVDYADILALPTADYIVSLSRGKDLKRSIVLLKDLQLPTFTEINHELISFHWNELKEYSDWTFPLGVSGYFYGKNEIQALMESIAFKAPNSLEIAMQVYVDLFIHRVGVCYPTTACCCIHANLTQTEDVNPILGTFSLEELLKKWEEGLMIDIEAYQNLTRDRGAATRAYTFVART